MKKLWDNGTQLDKFIEYFETKDDLVLDQKLVIADCICSIAHVMMLQKIGILNEKELNSLKKGLKEIIQLDIKGQFKLEMGDEDVHTKIENYLTQKYDEAGKKIHTGRSRNDQVLTDIRFFNKQEILSIWGNLVDLVEHLLNLAFKYEYLLMPGFTHMQKAMPSSLGMWIGCYIEGFLDDLIQLNNAYQINDQSPMGSGAGYGVSLPLDREYTAQLLGFAKVQSNSLYCQNSKGKIEAMILSALISILFEINKFASDVLLFTTSEFNYFEVSPALCSGSSIMPQKKNVDVAELLRNKIHLVLGNYTKIISLSSNLISGYNRDLQEIKKPIWESLEITQDSIKAMDLLINNLKPNKEVLNESLTPELFATHEAYLLVKKGIPFRKAYQKVAGSLKNLKVPDAKEIVESSNHIGGLGNLGLDKLKKQIGEEKKIWKKERKKFEDVVKSLIGKCYERTI